MEIELKFREFLEHYSKALSSFIRKIDHNEQLTSELVNLTSYLPDIITTSQRLYHFKYNIPKTGTCKICSKDLIYKGFTLGYRTYCNPACANKDPEFLKRREDTNLRNSGVRYSSQSKKAKETAATTRKNKTVEEKQAIQVKRKQTNLLIYGKEHPLQTEEIMDKQRQTNLFKRGVLYAPQAQEVKDKNRQTCITNHGVPNISCLPEVQKKKEESCLKTLGVKVSFQSEAIKELVKQNNLLTLGVEHHLQTKESLDKQKQTIFNTYGVYNISQHGDIKKANKIKQMLQFYNKLVTSERLKNLVVPLFTIEDYKGVENKYSFQCVKCSAIFEDHLNDGKIPRCLKCFPYQKNKSRYEDEIYEWLRELQVPDIIQKDKRTIAPLELDIYLPDYKLAIEFNGIYWHSELNGKDKNYHLNKTDLCKEKDIQLLHIFEDEWIEKQEIVKSHIKDSLGMFDKTVLVNDCVIKEISKKDAFNFLFENHFQKPFIATYNYGLYYGYELVSTVSLSKSRYNKNYKYELLRNCCKINTQVLGGFDKIISFVVSELKTNSIIFYVDKRLFTIEGYKNWNYRGATDCNYYYLKTYKERVSGSHFRRDAELTEWQNMQLAGYDRIWDCGNMIFTLCL